MFRYLLASLLLLSGPALAQNCENGAIFEATDPEGNLQILKTKGVEEPFVFEMQSKGQLFWSFEAEQSCSNGNSFCWLSVQTTEEEPLDVPVETISEEGAIKYYVFAHLRQSLASMRTDDEQFDVIANWSAERPADPIESMAMPVNVYAFKACR
nr:hypothetical protein [uncultured Cohaesibacter sp.]